jgi:glycosyltransferase involved in cell wall biosynthesis
MNLIPTDLSGSRIADAVRDPHREIAASSRVLDLSVGIVVCIPCFRRPEHLRLTLQSLVGQNTQRAFAVVMVENDAKGRESAPVATEFLVTGKLQGVCLVEQRQGNCRAINAAFETARALFPAATRFLMIDDDEIASPDWLELMVRMCEATGADVVGGPVLPVFDDDSKPWLARHPAFCPAYDYSGAVPLIYGCGNCLITRAAFDRLGSPAFDLRFNFLGGGDTDFFVRCRDAGMTFQWTAEAVITETVPRSRSSLGWIARRGLRIGAINYSVQRKAAAGAAARARVVALVLGRLPLSLFRAVRLITTAKPVVAMHPVMVALGAALAACGVVPKPYEASKIIVS